MVILPNNVFKFALVDWNDPWGVIQGCNPLLYGKYTAFFIAS